jgi:transposase
MLYYGLDVHKDFIQVCVINASNTYKNDYKFETTREKLEKFAAALEVEDQVVLESTFNSWSVYNILKNSPAKIKVAHARDVRAIAHAKVKTDRIDAHILAQLLRMDFIPEVTMPKDQAWETRLLGSHRRLLVKQKTAVKNSIHAVLHKNFLRCPYGLFTKKGIKWLLGQDLAPHERMMTEHLVTQLQLLEDQIDTVEDEFRKRALLEQNVRLLMTIPGVGAGLPRNL